MQPRYDDEDIFYGPVYIHKPLENDRTERYVCDAATRKEKKDWVEREIAFFCYSAKIVSLHLNPTSTL